MITTPIHMKLMLALIFNIVDYYIAITNLIISLQLPNYILF